MLILAIVFFLLTATLGLVLLTEVLQDNPIHKKARLLHGCFALIGLLLMITYLILYGNTSSLLTLSLTLFILAGLGGLSMFVMDLKNKKTPKIIAVIHPLVAFAGLVTLIIYILP